jgi:plastocyanin
VTRGALLAAVAAAVLALALPAVAHTPEPPARVSILFAAYDPPRITVLAGDPVTWTNTSPRDHTVTDRAGRFDSGVVPPQRSYAQSFTSSGDYPYFCRIHPTIQGAVEVRALLLRGPATAVPSGTQLELAGRAIAGVSAVTIQEDRGSGFRAISTAAVAAGKFHALVRPQASATYRAVAGPHISPAVRVVVGRPLALASRRRGRKSVRLTVKALTAQPGAPVVLQTWLKERFGWWPIGRRRLDSSSQARFDVRRRSRGRRLRVVLTERDGVTPRGMSNVVRMRGMSRRRR